MVSGGNPEPQRYLVGGSGAQINLVPTVRDMKYYAITVNEMRQLGFSNTLTTILLTLSSWAFGIATTIWASSSNPFDFKIFFANPVGVAALISSAILLLGAIGSLSFRESTIHEIRSTSVVPTATTATGGQSDAGIEGSG